MVKSIQEQMAYLSSFVTPHKQNLIEKIVANRTRHLTIVLENIYQPHNASAVIRSCECFGIQDLHVIEEKHTFQPNKGIVMGAAKWIDFYRYQNSLDCIQQLKTQDYQIVAMSLRPESIPLEELNITKKTALCFGTEEAGLSETIHQLADQQVYIPMHGFTQSFNVSVSAALCLHTLMTQLHASSLSWQLTEAEQEALTLRWMAKSAPKGEKLLSIFNSRI